jgi:hypothetical protein
MHDQAKYQPLEQSNFFGDQRSSRPIIEGTVSRENFQQDLAMSTGKDKDGKPLADFPMPLTDKMLERGQQRFNIFCSPCHDRLGTGEGMVVRRGYRKPPSFHIDRLRSVPPGYIFDVITNGFGAMPDYSAQIPVADRWAIIAYVRALQLSQNIPAQQLPEEDRQKLEKK